MLDVTCFTHTQIIWSSNTGIPVLGAAADFTTQPRAERQPGPPPLPLSLAVSEQV